MGVGAADDNTAALKVGGGGSEFENGEEVGEVITQDIASNRDGVLPVFDACEGELSGFDVDGNDGVRQLKRKFTTETQRTQRVLNELIFQN